ncbi:restriction endonuclease subunit S [Megamonas sp.]
MNVPKLRFKEFTDEWTTIKLSDIGEFLKGGQLNKSDLSLDGIPCILYGELYTFYNEFATKIKSKTLNTTNLVLSKKYDILLPLSGETAEDISTCTCVFFENIALGGDLIIFRSSLANNLFISLLLKYKYKYKIAQIAQGKSVVHINIKNLKNIKINIPNLEEQKKLSDFIFSINKKITTLENIITNLEKQKKGLLQQIFNQEIRFKDENGNNYPDWEKKKLNELCFKIGDGLHATPKYIDSGTNYFINGNNLLNKKIIVNELTKKVSTNELSKYYISLGNNSILISINGTIGNLAFYNNENIILGKSCGYINLKDDVIKDFIYYYLLQSKIQLYFHKELTGTTIKNLSLVSLKNTPIKLPCLEEQIKIADFLSAFDRKIDNQKAQLEHWKQIKKGLLQQMFV